MSMGKLYLVATPIGNIEDMSYRAVRILSEVDVVYAEDTRHSRKLWQRFDIETRLQSLHEHNEKQKIESVLARIESGDNVALISDAGTPAISDPGFPLVRACREVGIDVVPIPGACAAIAAVSASGLPTDKFTFLGFPPDAQGARKRWLQDNSAYKGTLILYLSPYKAARHLQDIGEVWGERKAVLVRELTKIYEEFRSGSLHELAARVAEEGIKGELTLVVEGALEEEVEVADIENEATNLAEQGMSVRDIADELRKRYQIKRKEAYDLALAVSDKQ